MGNNGGGVFIESNKTGGFVDVRGKDGEAMAQMGIDKNGGFVAVYGRRGDAFERAFSRAMMGVNEYGNGLVSTNYKNGLSLETLGGIK